MILHSDEDFSGLLVLAQNIFPVTKFETLKKLDTPDLLLMLTTWVENVRQAMSRHAAATDEVEDFSFCSYDDDHDAEQEFFDSYSNLRRVINGEDSEDISNGKWSTTSSTRLEACN
jgi:hypothetical protein